MRILTVLVVLIVALMVYIRLAPSKPEVWHKPVLAGGPGDYPEEGGFRTERRLNASSDEVLSTLHNIALATPRTQVLAGSPEAGIVTYVTRSLVMGFPDYTTAAVDDGSLRIYGRLRFGRSDLGVNRARIESWLAQLGGMIETP